MGREADEPDACALVADSSLGRDRKVKTGIYAEAGVPEYWIVNLAAMTIEVYTKPVDGRYERMEVLRDGDVLRPVSFPELAIAVADVPR